jgi:hypothetical protein
LLWEASDLREILWDIVHIIDVDPIGKGFENVPFVKINKKLRP